MQQASDLETKFATAIAKILKNHSENLFKQISEKDMKHGGSRPETFCKVDFRKNFERFTGKHLCRGFVFNKVAG